MGFTYTWYDIDDFELDDVLGFQTMNKILSNLDHLKYDLLRGRGSTYILDTFVLSSLTPTKATYQSRSDSLIYIPSNVKNAELYSLISSTEVTVGCKYDIKVRVTDKNGLTAESTDSTVDMPHASQEYNPTIDCSALAEGRGTIAVWCRESPSGTSWAAIGDGVSFAGGVVVWSSDV